MTTQYNVITYGSLTNTSGVLSNFSASNYATFNADTFADTNIELFFKAKFNSITSDSQVVYSFYDDSYTYSLCDIGLFGDKFYFEITNGEASLGDITGTTTAVANTDYYIKVIRNGNTYTLYLSTDGTTWTTEGFLTTTNHPSYTSAMNYLGGYVTSDGIDQIINGSINLNGSYIKLNGNYIWQGVTSTSNVQTRIQLRHDTAANWTSVNPVLLVGEVGIETDTLKQKVGDGSTAWNSLAYAVNMSTKQDTLVSGTNIKTVNNTSLLGSGNIDTSQIFFAQYGTTTTTQITQALGDGKAIFCIKSASSVDHIYYYSGTATLDGLFVYTFSRVYQNTTEVVYVSSMTNQWYTITKTLADDNLSNVSSIDANSAVQTALDTKVNKSGDTMTGNLIVSTNSTDNFNVSLKNTNSVISSTPSSNTFTSLAFTDNNNNALGRVLLRDTTTSREMRLRVDGYNGIANDAVCIGFDTNNTPYCTFPNTTCVDGQWIASYQEAIGTTAQTINAQTSKNIPFSNLPAKNCEVLFTISQSTNYDLGIYSDLIGSTTNRALRQGCISMILPVSSNKTIKVQNLGSGTASITAVRMYGYRVLGTNTNT